ncbi:MAG: methionine--tRNA ligase [Candidatus Moranbacteria bacterium]|nr:methionine--tRNA ligase [Candidatus Moranbacteria bacterium]
MSEKFYITTPIYYVNAKPHVGHAYTTIAADVLARFQKLQGKEVFFLTGTDEHGLKIQKKADEAGLAPQQFVDGISDEFKKLWKDLNIDYSNFIRTTDKKHIEAVQKVLQTLYDKGAIYKGTYSGMYCVGCEQFKSENELVDGKCPDHGTVPEKMEEECYLLKMTDIQERLIEKIEKNEFEIAPERYKNEILSFLKSQKLNDISISRKNVAWGIPLPFDLNQTAYVWIDAFLNYLTGLGWDGDEKNIPKEWPVDVQFIGKDILRVHATIWPAILLHLGIELPKMIFTHGHILSDGKKMSKTLGNSIATSDMIEKFGIDGTRYLLLSAGPFGQDIDVTMKRMIENYNADLANGLGNLVSRIIKLSESATKPDIISTNNNIIEGMKFDLKLSFIWSGIRACNKYIDDNKPWELVKNNKEEFENVILKLKRDLSIIANDLIPFMPDTAEKIKKALETKQVEILFPRIK